MPAAEAASQAITGIQVGANPGVAITLGGNVRARATPIEGGPSSRR